MFKKPFSFKGRIGRVEYFLSYIILLLVPIIGVVLLRPFLILPESSFGLYLTILFAILYMLYGLWFMFAQTAKRCHDIGVSGWWQLIPFYSFFLFFIAGNDDSNKYGPSPNDTNPTDPLLKFNYKETNKTLSKSLKNSDVVSNYFLRVINISLAIFLLNTCVALVLINFDPVLETLNIYNPLHLYNNYDFLSKCDLALSTLSTDGLNNQLLQEAIDLRKKAILSKPTQIKDLISICSLHIIIIISIILLLKYTKYKKILVLSITLIFIMLAFMNLYNYYKASVIAPQLDNLIIQKYILDTTKSLQTDLIQIKKLENLIKKDKKEIDLIRKTSLDSLDNYKDLIITEYNNLDHTDLVMTLTYFSKAELVINAGNPSYQIKKFYEIEKEYRERMLHVENLINQQDSLKRQYNTKTNRVEAISDIVKKEDFDEFKSIIKELEK